MFRYLKYSILFLLILMFSGCGLLTDSLEYNDEYVNSVLKQNTEKVKDKDIVIIPTNFTYSAHPNSLRLIARVLDFDGKEMDKFSEVFFKQYFEKTSISNSKKAYLTFKTDIKHFEHSFSIMGRLYVSIDFDVTVYEDNKLILKKNYKESTNDLDTMLFTINIDAENIINEDFFKTLYCIYDTKVKPDLLKALKENN